MAEASDEAIIEKLYEYGERLNESKDKSQNVEDYENIIKASKSSNAKAMQLAAQLIPRFFKHFPSLSGRAVYAQLDFCESEELAVRVQAIRGLPLFCKDTPEHLSKIVDILVQLLTAEENVERDAVNKALLSLLRQDVKASLTALFKHIETVDEQMSDDNLRERTLIFIKDKVFPLKAELLKPPEQMERHITDLIKKSLQDVTGAEFKMFMDFLKSLSIFGDKAPAERVQELIEIIAGQADLDAQFNVSDGDHTARLIVCLFMAIPFFERGASNSKFLNYLNKHIFPVFDKLPEERKVDLLKNLAESAPYTTPQDSRQILPSVVQLLKKYMPRRKAGEEMNFSYVECLLYTFHHLAHKAPNATNSLCGYKIVTGQPSGKAVLSTLDMFSFNFVLQSIENYATMKNYHGMTVSVQLLAEMMAYLAELTASDDPRFQRIADSLQHKIFYERDFLDRLPVLLKTWSPGLFPKAYVVDVVTLTHLVFKVLDSQGTIKVLSRRKAYLDKKRQKKKRAEGESKDGEDSDGSSTDEEETERQAQLLMEMQRKEADFDVRKYFSSMVSADTIRMYCSLLANYRENTAKVNHYIHSFFYRTKHFQIYQQEEWTMQPMLFSIHVLLLFNKMLQDTYIQRLPEYKNFLDFIRGVVRDFFSLADKNNLLFVEALLRQTYPSKSCMLIQRCYDPIDSMSKSKSEAVALGRERRIEAINESRRHRIAMDHEELEGEAEVQFTLGPSDFQSTSLVDKEGKEVEGEAEFNAEGASSNPPGAASAGKPKPKRKAPMSRAATERAKNWSKVEDRYLAKVFMKYRHLPSVYEVISYEDMFQERDRTPEQIERRVKYLKLHRKTHDSSDEDENEHSASDGEQENAQEEAENTVRESRLEKDLAELDTARPRRRLRRGADLSDDDSDDDMLLGGPASASTDPAQSTNDEPAVVVGAAPDEEMNEAGDASETNDADESQSQDMEETQVLEDSLDSRPNGRTEQSTEAQETQELDSAEATVDANSLPPANGNTDNAETGNESMNTESITVDMEAAIINDSQEHMTPEDGGADPQSLKRGRTSEDDTQDTPAKKVHREEAEVSEADASASQQ